MPEELDRQHVDGGRQQHHQHEPEALPGHEDLALRCLPSSELKKTTHAREAEDGADAKREVSGLRPVGGPARADPVVVDHHHDADREDADRRDGFDIALCDGPLPSRVFPGSCSMLASSPWPSPAPLLVREPGFVHQLGVEGVVLLEELDEIRAGQVDVLQRLLGEVLLPLRRGDDLLQQVGVERDLLLASCRAGGRSRAASGTRRRCRTPCRSGCRPTTGPS